MTFVRLDALSADDVASMRRLLTPDELLAADRLRRPAAAIQRIAGRAAARVGLSAYASVEPAAWELHDDALGKPSVWPEQAGRALWFSIAHTPGLAICAVSAGSPVGADCERLAPRAHMPELARRVLAPEELAVWTNLPATSKTAAFYDAWTAKEAVAKAIGAGIQIGLNRIAPDGTGQYAVRGRDGERWHVLRPDVSAEHRVAVALPADQPPA